MSQRERDVLKVVSNDYTIRFRNRFFQLLKPANPGERGGRMIVEERINGTLAIRFKEHYLHYEDITRLKQGCEATQPELNHGEPITGEVKLES